MPNLTPNFSFNQPLVNNAADEDLWGGQLNTNWGNLDGILPVPAANKFGAVVVQSTDDASFEIVSGQGTSNQVLTSNGADALPSFQTNFGEWELLETQTASSSATIDFTSNIDSTFTNYAVLLSSVVPANDSVKLQLRISIASTFQTNGFYSWSSVQIASNASTITGSNGNGDTEIELNTNQVIGNDTSEGCNGSVMLYNPSNASLFKQLETKLLYLSSGANFVRVNGGGTYTNSAGAVDGLRFFFDSGNIASGTFKLYGIN